MHPASRVTLPECPAVGLCVSINTFSDGLRDDCWLGREDVTCGIISTRPAWCILVDTTLQQKKFEQRILDPMSIYTNLCQLFHVLHSWGEREPRKHQTQSFCILQKNLFKELQTQNKSDCGSNPIK